MRYVLFVCNHNAGRSQMAQAVFECLAPPNVRAESAGSEPAKEIWPEVTHIVTLALRQTRECLRKDRSDATASV